MSQTLIQIFDPPLCCSTGVCGPDVDPELVRVAAQVEKWKSQGHEVQRHNLGHEPLAFVQNAEVKRILDEKGVDALPLVFVDGSLVAEGTYPGEDAVPKAATE